MSLKLMGRKRGMMQRFDKDGNVIVCTVIEAPANVITQIKTRETDGYEAVQSSFELVVAPDERTVARRVGKPQMGHFGKAGVAPRRFLIESKGEGVEGKSVGDELTVSLFEEGAYVDVMGVTKGKGYQGGMKLHGFSGGPAAHGSGFHRHVGSTGMRSTPGRCFPGGKRASQMGRRRSTVQNLKVVGVDATRGIILLSGAVPGYDGALVVLSAAIKQKKKAK